MILSRPTCTLLSFVLCSLFFELKIKKKEEGEGVPDCSSFPDNLPRLGCTRGTLYSKEEKRKKVGGEKGEEKGEKEGWLFSGCLCSYNPSERFWRDTATLKRERGKGEKKDKSHVSFVAYDLPRRRSHSPMGRG